MSVSASSCVAKRRSRMPGALDDPLVGRVDELREVVVRDDLGRHVHAEAGDPDLRAVRLADHCSTANVSVPANGELAADSRPRLAATDRAAHRLEQALEGQLLARADDALEPDVVDACEQRELAAILLLDEHGDRAGLRERLDHLHAGHDRVAGEVPGAILFGDHLARDDARAGLELEHLVEQAGTGRGAEGSPRSAPCRRARSCDALLEPFAKAVSRAVRVALRRADRHPARGGDLLERVARARPSGRRPAPEPAGARAGRRAARHDRPRRRAESRSGRRAAPPTSGAARARRGTCSRRAGAATSRTATRRETAGFACRPSPATPASRLGRPRDRAGSAERSSRLPADGERTAIRAPAGRRPSHVSPRWGRSASRRRATSPPAGVA